MFKQVFRLAFVTLIWKQYKAVIISTAILFAYLYLVGSVHSDYLLHASLQNNGSASGLSFIIKWLALAFGVVCYGVFHIFRSKPRALSSKSKAKQQIGSASQDDPFDEIRKRKKLRGPGDFFIEDELAKKK